MSDSPGHLDVPEARLPAVGELTAVDVAGRAVAIANVDGAIFAFADRCTHEECALSAGFLEGHRVICDCHGGEFDVRTGEAVAGPVQHPLATFAVTAVAGGMRIHREAPPAAE